MELFVVRSGEMNDGDMRLVEADGFEVGVYRHDGRYHAYRNVCTHQGGPACEGVVMSKVEDVIGADRTYRGQRFDHSEPHIVCPWHGYEFVLATGECATDRRQRLRKHDVVERDGQVYVVV